MSAPITPERLQKAATDLVARSPSIYAALAQCRALAHTSPVWAALVTILEARLAEGGAK